MPGSGKTFTLSLLAARLVERLADEGQLDEKLARCSSSPHQQRGRKLSEAMASSCARQASCAQRRLRVRTLHGLAHDIVTNRPGLVGLSEDFDIIDERTAGDEQRGSAGIFAAPSLTSSTAFIQPSYLKLPHIERFCH